jgi:TatD DNase family protein
MVIDAQARPAVRAIGEIGLDYHYDFAPRDLQRELLALQVGIAAEHDRPVVIHAREAEQDVLDVLHAGPPGRVRGVFHCYTGDVTTVRQVLALGFYVGFGGIVTFPRGENVRDVLKTTPLDRMLIETDSPFLAPVPHRGKRNEPAWVAHVAKAVAKVIGVTRDEVAERTTTNFRELFRP